MKLISTLIVLVMISSTTFAANFSVLEENGEKIVVCSMNKASKIALYQDLGLKYGDRYPSTAQVHSQMPGTKVYVDGVPYLTTKVSDTNHGFQSMSLRQDEYQITMVRPNGARIQFQYLTYQNSVCVLDFDELSQALSR